MGESLHKISVSGNYIIKKVRVVSLARNSPSGPYLCLNQILSKIFQTIMKLQSAQEFGLEIHSGEITRKKKQNKSCRSCM